MLKEYIIQEKESVYVYTDVITCTTLSLARKYYVILREKYPHKEYRIVRCI